jgi:replicative DNA helicase
MNLDRKLPSAPNAERAVLGAALMNAPSVMPRITPKISPDDFYERRNRIIWEALKTVFVECGDANDTSVTERLRADGDLDFVGGYDAVSALTHPIPDIAGVHLYVHPLREAALRRRVIQLAASVAEAAYAGQTSELLHELEAVAVLDLSRIGRPAHAEADPQSPIPLSQFLAQASGSTEWLIDGLLPQGGIALLVAKPKVGKSTISRDLTHALVTGRPFLSRQVHTGPRALSRVGRSL